jgi:hypothetical protein
MIKAAPELEYMYRKFFSRNDLPQNIRSVEKEAMVNMLFTTAGYYMSGGDRKAAAQTALRALRQSPELFYRPSFVHKAFYCLYGSSALYQRSRDAYHRARANLASR